MNADKNQRSSAAKNFRSLFELEVRAMDRTVVQLHYQLPARTSPGCLSLPHVDVLIRYWIVTEATAASRYCLR